MWYSYKLILGGLHSYTKEALDVAWHASILFAVHPIHVEAVSGIVGRADILCAVTFFISFILYHNAIKEGSYWKLFASIIMAAVSMLFKETGITVLVIIIYDYLFVNCSYRKITEILLRANEFLKSINLVNLNQSISKPESKSEFQNSRFCNTLYKYQ